MKVWMLAGLFTVATIPFAAAVETDGECQGDDARRVAPQVRIDGGSAGGSAPAPTARQTSAQRPSEQMAQRAPGAETAEPAAPARAQPTQRRRNGKRIPDAELIGPRGAL